MFVELWFGFRRGSGVDAKDLVGHQIFLFAQVRVGLRNFWFERYVFAKNTWSLVVIPVEG